MKTAKTTIDDMKSTFEFIKSITPPTKDVVIEQTLTTPFIRYNNFLKSLTIIGKSTMTNAKDFYHPLFVKIYDNLITHGYGKVEINLSEINSKTIQMLFELFGNLQHYHSLAKEVDIVWINHDNTEIEELGKSIKELFHLDIKFKKRKYYNK